MNDYPLEAISKILASALGLWLRTQTERLDELQIKISGQNRQLLGGLIPHIFLTSRQTVYQGLHLSQVQLESQNIRVNIGRVYRGEPLRLLEPIRVRAKVLLEESALSSSLLSPLLSQALADLLLTLDSSLDIHILKDSDVSWRKATVNSDRLALVGIVQHFNRSYRLMFCCGLSLKNCRTLSLQRLQLITEPELISLSLQEFSLDLGSDVELTQLSLIPGKISCSGQIIVRN